MSGVTEDGNYTGVFRRGARGTIDIIADILSLCGSWNKRTKIMYKANLSHQMLKFYIWHLSELGLLEQSKDMKFKTTEKRPDISVALPAHVKIANRLEQFCHAAT